MRIDYVDLKKLLYFVCFVVFSASFVYDGMELRDTIETMYFFEGTILVIKWFCEGCVVIKCMKKLITYITDMAAERRGKHRFVIVDLDK